MVSSGGTELVFANFSRGLLEALMGMRPFVNPFYEMCGGHNISYGGKFQQKPDSLLRCEG